MLKKRMRQNSRTKRPTVAMVRYTIPSDMFRYDRIVVATALAEAKAAVLSLQTIPYQRSWVEELQRLELKREVAGTSRIEGADFTDRELEAALQETAEQLATRSQRQARAAVQTYRWIATLPTDRPLDESLIREIHRRIIEGADDDHCAPGKLRGRDENVTFGAPRHRGAEGGDECRQAFSALVKSIREKAPGHDPVIQALAVHYHLAAMHPFGDGNGRTARAIEALLLQRAGLKDTCFIAMSNYYYEEKNSYLGTLAEVRAKDFDLTPFLLFGLKGVAAQSLKLLAEIRHQVAKGLFRNLMYDLFGRLKSPKKRVLARRQTKVLTLLLEAETMSFKTLMERTDRVYESLKSPGTALIRDLNALIALGAIAIEPERAGGFRLRIRLEWPTEITETKFFEQVGKLPKAKTLSFLP